MRRPDVRLTTFVTMVARTPSCAELEQCLISASCIAITGTRWIVENLANITAQTPTWAAPNLSQAQLKHRKALTSKPRFHRPLSTDRSTFSALNPLLHSETTNKSKKLTDVNQ